MLDIDMRQLLNLIDLSDNENIKLRNNSLNKDSIKQSIQMKISKALNTNSATDKVHNKFNAEKSFNERVRFLKESLLESETKSLVLGISGGVDSLTAGFIAQRAVDELNEETTCFYQFIAIRLPYGKQKDEVDVNLSLEAINPSVIEYVDIKDTVDSLSQSLTNVYDSAEKNKNEIDFIKGNIKARVRMMAQYAIANTYNGLVVGTDHAAESVTGFFTKYGDGAADVMPLTGLVKHQVREISQYCEAPESLYLKTATADLEDLKEGVSDEDSLGISYQDIDKFLLMEPVSDEVFSKILDKYMKTQHKRKMPKHMF